MQLQGKIDDLGFCPSFNCYSLTSTAAAKVSLEFKQEQADQFHDIGDVDEEEDFEFSLVLAGDEVSAKELALDSRRFVFPVFNSDLLMKDEVEETDDAASVRIHIQKLFVDDREDSSCTSSSEADESEGRPSGTFCVWRPKADVGSATLTKCKKSSSTGSGSGSKRWRFRDLLRRSNSEGKESIWFLGPKKVEGSKQKRNINSGEVHKVTGKLKAPSSPSFHELFYVQKRAEKEGDKMKSYLPYRLGFFANVNGIGKKLPF